jgi:TonB family protein
VNVPLWLDNLTAYSLQVLLLAAVAGALPYAFRLRTPRLMLAYWQTVLALCLLLPALQPWKPAASPSFHAGLAASNLTANAAAVDRPSFPVDQAVVLALAVGFAARLLWLALGLYRLRRHRRTAHPLAAIPSAIEEIQSRIGVRPSLYLSAELDSPVTVGLFCPAILFPVRFLRMPPSFQQAIACHELLHVRRRDWAVSLLEELLRTLFWFHPGIWWLLGQIQLTREQVVDRQVVFLTQARESYLEALLEVARGRRAPGMAAAPSFLREPHLAIRVAAILKEATMSKTRLLFSLAVIVSSVLLAGQLVVRAFPLQAPTPDQTAQEKVYRAGKDVIPPVLIHKVEPQYSQQALAVKLEGTVVVRAEIWPDGLVHNPRIIKSLGMGLDEKALEALQQWTFKPGEKDGQPVKVAASIEINFRLGQASEPDRTAQQNLYRVGSGVIPPVPIHKVEPHYSPEALAAKLEGTVVVRAEIWPDGLVHNPQVTKSLGMGLDEKAIEALQQWRFKPGEKDGKPVKVAASIEINFRLK